MGAFFVKKSQMHPNTMKLNKTWVLGPMGWIGCVCCEKFRCNFVAQTFALIAPVRPVLHRVYCRNEIIPHTPEHYETLQNMSLGSDGCVLCEKFPNAPKHYETQQNMSFGSNGVDRVHSLRQIRTRLSGTNYCINCPISARFAPSFMQ